MSDGNIVDLTGESSPKQRAKKRARPNSSTTICDDLRPIGVDICPDMVDLVDDDAQTHNARILDYEFSSTDFDPWKHRWRAQTTEKSIPKRPPEADKLTNTIAAVTAVAAGPEISTEKSMNENENKKSKATNSNRGVEQERNALNNSLVGPQRSDWKKRDDKNSTSLNDIHETRIQHPSCSGSPQRNIIDLTINHSVSASASSSHRILGVTKSKNYDRNEQNDRRSPRSTEQHSDYYNDDTVRSAFQPCEKIGSSQHFTSHEDSNSFIKSKEDRNGLEGITVSSLNDRSNNNGNIHDAKDGADACLSPSQPSRLSRGKDDGVGSYEKVNTYNKSISCDGKNIQTENPRYRPATNFGLMATPRECDTTSGFPHEQKASNSLKRKTQFVIELDSDDDEALKCDKEKSPPNVGSSEYENNGRMGRKDHFALKGGNGDRNTNTRERIVMSIIGTDKNSYLKSDLPEVIDITEEDEPQPKFSYCHSKKRRFQPPKKKTRGEPEGKFCRYDRMSGESIHLNRAGRHVDESRQRTKHTKGHSLMKERRYIFHPLNNHRTVSYRSKNPTVATRSTWFERNFSYNFTRDAALQEQERLFKESAERIRSQAHFRVVSGFQHPRSDTIVFEAPVLDIASKHPDHWRFLDPYARLGLPRGATSTTIKSQYRRLALLYHPDKSNMEGTTNRFQAVTEAYQAIMESVDKG